LYEFNIRDGVRDSIASALLGRKRAIVRNDKTIDEMQPTSIPKNLIIRTGVTVTRVLTKMATTANSEGKLSKPRTIGVEYISTNGEKGTFLLNTMPMTAKTQPQVILAAGALLTPQILFNSGIGENGPIVHLPGVGKNLHDHPVVAMSFQLDPNLIQHSSSIYTVGQELEDYLHTVTELTNMDSDLISSYGKGTNYNAMDEDNLRNATNRLRQIVQERLGTFGTPGFSAGAFLRSPWAKDDAPDIQLTVFPRVMEPHVTGKNEQAGSLRHEDMLITVALLHPEARYEVQAAAKNKKTSTTGIEPANESSLIQQLQIRLPSLELPSDRSEYLTSRDVKILAWGMEQVRRISGSSPMKDSILQETTPGLGIDVEDFVRKNHLPNSHWVGSTKMGSKDDPLAVLDEELRVRGIDGLRIVDAGSIPNIPNGNTHSTVCIVASRAAEMIIAERFIE
jgi:choline dehydrogenase